MTVTVISPPALSCEGVCLTVWVCAGVCDAGAGGKHCV